MFGKRGRASSGVREARQLAALREQAERIRARRRAEKERDTRRQEVRLFQQLLKTYETRPGTLVGTTSWRVMSCLSHTEEVRLTFSQSIAYIASLLEVSDHEKANLLLMLYLVDSAPQSHQATTSVKRQAARRMLSTPFAERGANTVSDLVTANTAMTCSPFATRGRLGQVTDVLATLYPT